MMQSVTISDIGGVGEGSGPAIWWDQLENPRHTQVNDQRPRQAVFWRVDTFYLDDFGQGRPICQELWWRVSENTMSEVPDQFAFKINGAISSEYFGH